MRLPSRRAMLPALMGSSRLHPGYGVAAVSTVAVILSAPGQTMLISLLNLPLREAFELEPLVLNTSYMVATVLASLPLVWVGQLVDRLGPRKMMLIVAAAFGGACLFTATIAHPVMVFVAFFLLRFFGQGTLALVSHHALAMWFHRRLGTVAGFRQVALFGCWAGFPFLTTLAIGAWGWRATWAGFGLVIPLALWLLTRSLLVDRPEDVGVAMDGLRNSPESSNRAEPGYTLREAMRTPAYWVLVAGAVLPPMIGTALLFDMGPLLVARGLEASSAATTVGAWSGTMALMAIPSGRLIDRVRPGSMLLAGTSTLALSCLLWLFAHTLALACAGMVLYALGQSLVMATVGTTAARFFGRRHHGAIRSSLTRLGVIATGLGPLAFGLSHLWTGSYKPALTAFALLCLLPAVALPSLAPPREDWSGIRPQERS